MNKREYNAMLDELKTLPVPGTILYTPADKDKADVVLLLRWEIREKELRAVIQLTQNCEITWLSQQVRMCTWKD